ncbi:spore coat protein CotS [Clostridium tetanomorphum]|nr:spore coat protein CotS [Clostridium tetanomorphum]
MNYIKTMQFYKELGKKAMKVLHDSKYIDLCRVAEEEKSFVIMTIPIII